MAQILLQLDSQNNGKNVILFDVYCGKLINFNILIIFGYSYSRKHFFRYAVCTFKIERLEQWIYRE